jgi:geranylgeranyl diphosphate synthase type II
MNLREYLHGQQRLVESELDRLVPPEATPPETIHRAMRYSLFAGGKRIRPILCMEAARAVNDAADGVVSAACALELIHTYSLIHDDLPALDNDDYRRGKLTNHKVFGEAMAILAGDALLTLAFQVLAEPPVASDRKARIVAMIAELAAASGTVGGMIGGQVADLEGEGKPPDAQLLETIHRAKTGALLRASLRLGAIYAGAAEEQYAALSCSRLWTIFWTWRNLPRNLARPPARTRPSIRSRFRRSTAWKLRTAWPRRNASGPTIRSRCSASAPRACTNWRTTLSTASHEDAPRPAAGGTRPRRVPREGPGADHGRRSDRG